MKRRQDYWPLEEKNSVWGQRLALIAIELLCNKVLLKYKGDRESFRKGQKSTPLLVFSWML